MKHVTFILLTIAASCASYADPDDPAAAFFADLERARDKFRLSQSEVIRKADRVVIYLVDFEVTAIKDPFGNCTRITGDDTFIGVDPSGGVARILSTKEVPEEHESQILNAFAAQIAKPEHGGGPMCHFPIHGVRVYRGEELLHEGTLCWWCGNFSFSYPEGSDWLDTSKELEESFKKLLPIPEEELERFYAKYPGAKPKGEQVGADQPATAPDSKEESDQNPKSESEGRSK
jgi:hypothetical protein